MDRLAPARYAARTAVRLRPPPDAEIVGGEVSSCPRLDHVVVRRSEFMECAGADGTYSGLIPANFTTLAHFSVSSAMSLPNSAGEPAFTIPPRPISRAFTWGSAKE